MQVTRQYKAGGFFGNSQAKFSDMEGAGGGINMGYAHRGLLKTKGAALRREKRHLKQLERQGKLNEYGTQSADRLDYLRNVQKDRGKKTAGAIGTAALIAGTAGLATGAIGAGAAGAAGAGAGAGAGAAGVGTGLTATAGSGLGATAGGIGAGLTPAALGATGAAGAGAGTAATAAGGAGASGLAAKAGSLLANPKTQKALKVAKQVAKTSNLPEDFGQTQSQPLQPLQALKAPSLSPQGSGGLVAPGQNVGGGLMSSLPPSLIQGILSKGLVQGQSTLPIQNFDPAEENFDDGSGFDLMGALQAFGQYAGENGMRISKKGSKLPLKQQKMLLAMFGARLPR